MMSIGPVANISFMSAIHDDNSTLTTKQVSPIPQRCWNNAPDITQEDTKTHATVTS